MKNWSAPVSGTFLLHRDVIWAASRADVVLLGETHDRYDIHRWQLHVAAGLAALRDVAIGFEMFPRSAQPVLDAWSDGKLGRKEFLEKVEWEKVWGFDANLYMPLFDLCRDMRIPMKALNCRRALVTDVGKFGWEAIAEQDRDGLSPAKPATSAYRQFLFDITGGKREGREAHSASDNAFDRFVRAQQTWDRAFACNIAKALEENAQRQLIGIIGRGHLEYGHGTPYQLADLGIVNVQVLLPADETPEHNAPDEKIADALFLMSGWPERAPPRER